MKAKYSNYYRKQGGTTVFVYVVTGTAVELDSYKTAQGVNYRENEEAKPLFFSMRPLTTNPAEEVKLIITPNGRVVADDSLKAFSREARLEEYIIQEQAKLMAQRAVLGHGVTGVSNLTATRPIEVPAFDIPVDIEQDIPA